MTADSGGIGGTPRPAGSTAGAPAGAAGLPVARAPARAPKLTPDGRLTTGRLRGLSMNRALWVLCWPVLVESYLQWLVGVVDTKLAANLSVAAAEAVGPAAYFMWLIGLLGMALGVGATAVVARSVGKGRRAVAGAAMGQTVVLALLLGAAAGFALYQGVDQIGSLVGLSGPALSLFNDYMRVIALGVPLSSLLVSGIACLRGAGDSIGPLRAMAVVNAVNIAGSWLLSGVPLLDVVSPLAPALGGGLGITGIAWGTVIGQAVGAAIVVGMLASGRSGVRLRPRRLRLHAGTAWRVARIGLPNFFESLGMWAGNFVIVMLVGSIAAAGAGEGVFGAHIIAIRIEAASFLPGFAIGTAAATLVGQYLGAGSAELARTALLRALCAAAVIMGLLGAAFVLVPNQIAAVFSPQEVHLETVPGLLRLCGLVQVPFAVALVIRSGLRGAGDARAVMIITWLTTYAVRIPLAFILSGADLVLHRSAEGADPLVLVRNPWAHEPSLWWLWVALTAELAIRGGVFFGRYLSGAWTRAKV